MTSRSIRYLGDGWLFRTAAVKSQKPCQPPPTIWAAVGSGRVKRALAFSRLALIECPANRQLVDPHRRLFDEILMRSTRAHKTGPDPSDIGRRLKSAGVSRRPLPSVCGSSVPIDHALVSPSRHRRENCRWVCLLRYSRKTRILACSHRMVDIQREAS